MTSKLHLQLWRTYNSHKKAKVFPTLKEICIIQKQQMERKSLTQSKTTFTYANLEIVITCLIFSIPVAAMKSGS